MIPGKFYGHPYMDYLTYNYDEPGHVLPRWREGRVLGFSRRSSIGATSHVGPDDSGDTGASETPARRGPRLLFDKQRAETNIQPDGGPHNRQASGQHRPLEDGGVNITIDTTKRVVFFSPTECRTVISTRTTTAPGSEKLPGQASSSSPTADSS